MDSRGTESDEHQPLLKSGSADELKSEVGPLKNKNFNFQPKRTTALAGDDLKLQRFPGDTLQNAEISDVEAQTREPTESPPVSPAIGHESKMALQNESNENRTKDCRARYPVSKKREKCHVSNFVILPSDIPSLNSAQDTLIYQSSSDTNVSLDATTTFPEFERQYSDSGSLSITDLDSSTTSDPGTFSILNLSTYQKLLLVNVLLGDFLTSCCMSVLAPIFPKEALSKNVSDSVSGWIFGVFSLTTFVVSPICGQLMPQIGGRFMYIAGAFWSGGCTVLFGFLEYVPTKNGNVTYVVLCFVLRIVLATGVSAVQTAGFAYTFKEFPNSIATVFGIMEIFVGLGFMTGPAIGGLLYGAGGFYLPFAVIGGLILASIPYSWFVLPQLEDPNVLVDDGSLKTLLKLPSIMLMNVLVVIGGILWSILDPTLQPHLMQFGISEEIVGLIFFIMATSYALSAPLVGRVADAIEDNKLLLIPGFVMCGLALLLLGPSPVLGITHYKQLWLNVLSLCLLGVGTSFALIPSFDIFLELAETVGFQDTPSTYGVVAGLWNAVYSLGDFIGPSIGGVLVSTVGFPMCMTYTAVLCACVVVMLVSMEIHDHFKKASSKVTMETKDYQSRQEVKIHRPEVETSHELRDLHNFHRIKNTD